MFVARTPGFMPLVSEEALWQELNNVRFTTPILRSWLPHIEASLREQDYLEDAYCFNAPCGVLNLNTEALDKIVSEGITLGKLSIGDPKPKAKPVPEPEPGPPFEPTARSWKVAVNEGRKRAELQRTPVS
jgi:hypothetical protein